MSHFWQTLIDAEELFGLLESERPLVLFDCRHQLTAPEAGLQAWQESHLPGAFYAHLDTDQAGPKVPGVSGRHPLPDREILAKWLGQRGVETGVQVVVYDDAGGAIAARLWWMLQWLGHEQVAVLNGGVQAWQNANFPMDNEEPKMRLANFAAKKSEYVAIEVDQVEDSIASRELCLLDARDGARYRGEVEPFGPVAGHVPGAHSMPFAENLHEGFFKSIDELKQRFANYSERGDVVCYCGSGVTGCHNILAMVHAGMEKVPALYTGSWSEWSLDSTRPVATGASPG